MWPHSSPAHSRPDSTCWEEGGECREALSCAVALCLPPSTRGNNMVRARGLTVLIVAALAVFACGSSSSAGSKGTIMICVSLPLSGSSMSQGTPTKNGVLFYVQQHPTVDGYTLRVSAKDYAVNGSPNAAKGAATMQEFIADSSVLAVVGTFDAGVARAEIPLANTVFLAMISPANTNPCLTKDNYTPGVLRANGQDVTCNAAGPP